MAAALASRAVMRPTVVSQAPNNTIREEIGEDLGSRAGASGSGMDKIKGFSFF